MKTRLIASCVAAFVLSVAASAAADPAQFIIINTNAPGVGFNDPTPVAPVGGNPGTTLGQQRMNVFLYAASIWSATIDSTVPIRIRAQMIPLAPGVLGNSGPPYAIEDFPNAALANTFYHPALSNKMAGADLVPEQDDMLINFSTNFPFYLGLDNNHGPLNDLVTVILHEIAHSLGFSQFANINPASPNFGALFGGLPDVYNTHLRDNSLGLTWPQMTNAQRAASASRFGRVVWIGALVTTAVPNVLSFGSPEVRVTAPAAIAGPYQFGTAAFGPPIGPTVSAAVVAAVDASDAAGPATTDGCSAFTNAAAMAGRIALVERGTCGFAVKARNAQAAGALATIIYNNAANAAGGPPGMANDGGPAVLIPSVSLTRADGLTLAGTAGVTATLGVDLSIRAGADATDHARVYAPFPIAGGSSISHFDTVASRNLLMEPFISADLTHKVEAPDDLTHELLRDVGWYQDEDGDLVANDLDCDAESDFRATIFIGTIDTGVPNMSFQGGCSAADLIAHIADAASNHGDFIAGVAHLRNQWKDAGLISGSQNGAIQSAAARAKN